MVFEWIRSLFGKKPPAAEVGHQNALQTNVSQSSDEGVISLEDPRITEGHEKLRAYWEAVGQLDPDLVSYIINPGFAGAPIWPNTRQAYSITRTERSLILASDGLSDPFVGTDMNDVSGFGLEVYIEIEGAQDWSLDDIMKSAEFDAISLTAQNMAGHGGVAGLLDELSLLSMALPISREPGEGWLDENGQLVVLLGMPAEGRPARVAFPFGPVRFVPITPLRPTEGAAVATSAEQRETVGKLLENTSSKHRFNANRPAVL